MNLTRTLRLAGWLLIVLNLLMALGSIWIFMRMTPAIQIILHQNERSLNACETMLASLAMIPGEENNLQLVTSFKEELQKAENNITENEEIEKIIDIRQHHENAFGGDIAALRKTVYAITALSEINRRAMHEADLRAQQLGNAGGWGIVFMATAVFIVGMLFMRGLRRSIVQPLEEINTVLAAFRQGDRLRRCSGSAMPKDIRTIFGGINDLLDKYHSKQ